MVVLGLAALWQVLHHDVIYYRVASASMEPTLGIGARVAAERDLQPRIGDVVVFRAPAGALPATPQCAAPGEGAGFSRPCDASIPEPAGPVFVKRVLAIGGDRIAIVGGRAVVNGRPAHEPYAATCGGGSSCDFPDPVTVPAGQYFVLGDNRGTSDDSRFWGPVRVASILGVVVRCSALELTCRRR